MQIDSFTKRAKRLAFGKFFPDASLRIGVTGMSLFDNSQRSTSGLQLPGLINQLSPAEQLPFPENSSIFSQTTPRPHLANASGPTTPAPEMVFSPAITQPLSDADNPVGDTQKLAFNTSPAVTRILPDLQSGTFSSFRTTTSFRQLILFRGSGKQSTGTMRPPMGRSLVISSLVLGLMLVITLFSGFIVIPLATGNHNAFDLFQFCSNYVQSNA